MSTNFLFVCPSHHYNRQMVRQLIDDCDSHKWVIGFEVGKNGYRHIQGRINLSMGETDGFNRIKEYLDGAHVEKCSDNWEYERKDGHFLSSEDTEEIRKVRFGKLRPLQKDMLDRVRASSDREIVVWWDEYGNMGKSWLCNYLYETNQGFYLPPTIKTVQGMIQEVASGYHGQGIIVIDIPRSSKWTTELYEAIECIKDGLVYDTRYSSKRRNIRGAKILVMCNTLPKLDKLSKDRWRVYDWLGELKV